MALTEKIDFKSGISLKKTVTFNKKDKDHYEDIFAELKEQEVIQKGLRFEDKNWVVWREGLKISNFSFELPFHLRKWELILKALILIQLKNKRSRANLRAKLNAMKDIVVESWGLMDTSAFASYFDNTLPALKEEIITATRELLAFTKTDATIANEIRDIFKSTTRPNFQRVLPPYSDIVLFHNAFERFSLEWDEKENKKYAPLYLWWRLTSILPLRPKEFTIIPNECILKKNNDIFLTVRRIKDEGVLIDDENVPLDEIPITEEVCEWIKSYKDLTASYPQSQYLLSFKMYDESKNNLPGVQSKNQDVSTKSLDHLLDDFYLEIIYKKYQMTPEPYLLGNHKRICLNDTRHLAICNMMFMNFSPLTIQRLANHENINSQNPYAAHMELYTQSKVEMLTETFRLAIRQMSEGNVRNLSQIPEGLRRRRIFKIDDFSHLWPLPHGCFCLHTPLDCPIEDCRFCPFLFVPKENWVKAIDWLADCSEKLEEQLSFTLSSLMSIRTDITKRHESNNRAGELSALVHRKALVDAQYKELQNKKWEQKNTLI